MLSRSIIYSGRWRLSGTLRNTVTPLRSSSVMMARPFTTSSIRHQQSRHEPQDDELTRSWKNAIVSKGFFGSAKPEDESTLRQRGEMLLYRTTNKNRIWMAASSGLLPLIFGTTGLVLRLFDFVPMEQQFSYLTVSLLYVTGAFFTSLSMKIANFTVREIVLTDNGSKARLRTFRLFWGYGPSVTVPVSLLMEKIPDKEDNFRYIGIAEDLGHMMIHKRGQVYNEELFERILQGQPVDLSEASSTKDDSSYESAGNVAVNPDDWERDVDDRGRAYYKNKHTGETRWTNPSFSASEDQDK
eukprot:gb/GECG01015305.1/.p1 GENE.gb/GECG01015305.1/~~gb/GECG01015305.1/.p1  ORF type:complete len:299 (+),score=30.26 gb/GECG01015305.1/:1-897(+)